MQEYILKIKSVFLTNIKRYGFLTSVLFFLFSFQAVRSQQTFIIYDEDFNSGNNSVILNSGPVGSNSGANKWIVNNLYDGLTVYPNTTPQNITSAGTIGSAPNSPYLHIHDQATVATGGANANYNPTAVSDNFAYMQTGVCTKGLKGAQLTFFSIINGSSTAYGELYYSINSGPWIKKGSNYENNTGNPVPWKYEIVTDPAFDDVINLRFGFRWQNNNSAPPANAISWGIDDIQVIGTFDNTGAITPPITINVTNLPASICRSGAGATIFANINLSDTLCDGQYSIELSNASGNFPPIASWSTNINYPDTTGVIFVTIPSSVPSGICYKFRVNRVSPLPAITGIASVCFEIKDCPITITTKQPAVTKDTCNVCIGSVIDVPFNSEGTFNTNNVYTAQLSDVNGNFSAPVVLGTLPTGKEFPDPTQPGSISGLIPLTTLPGCSYYVRVVSNNPSFIGTVWGPFCIRECDIKTNNMIDVHVCVTQTVGDTVQVPIDINMWNALTNYGASNQFEIQLLDFKTLELVNQGGLGIKASVTSTVLTLIVPPAPALAAMGLTLPPGIWYMRIFPTNPNPAYCTVGTMVRFSYGIYGGALTITVDPDTLFCLNDIGRFYVHGARFESNNQWYINGGPRTITSFGEFQGFGVRFNGLGTYKITVQEDNNGCKGPMSDPITISVIGVPSASITGPNPVCMGDTLTYKVSFLTNTHYDWTINPLNNSAVDTGNNVIKIKFGSAGTYSLTLNAFNECGSNSGKKTIIVKDMPPVTAYKDTAICLGTSVELNSIFSASITSYSWKSNGSTLSTGVDSIYVSPDVTTAYSIHVKDMNNCKNSDTVTVTIKPLPDVDAGPDTYVCVGNSTELSASGGDFYSWSPGTSLSSTTIANPIANPNTSTIYHLTATSLLTGCTNFDSLKVTVLKPDSVNDDAVILCKGTPTTFKTEIDGAIYLWSTSEATQEITVTKEGIYVLTIINPFDNCSVLDTFKLAYKNCDIGIFVPSAFTPNGDNLNDIFYAYPTGINKFEMDIFDRWGNLIFHSENDTKGWDGRYKGTLVMNDVYVWKVKVSGNLTGEEKTETHYGKVVVLK